VERNLPVELVPLNGVSRESPYGWRFDYEDPALQASVERRGILFPLLLVRGSEGQAEVISGHKRLNYARQEGLVTIPAFFVDEDFSEKERFLLSVYSNWGQRFSELDRMEAISRAEKRFGFGEENIREELCPALGIDEKGPPLEVYRKAGRLAREIHLLICKGRLPFRGIASLERFSVEEQARLACAVFDKMHLTTNQLLLVSDWIYDLKRGKQGSLEGLLEEASVEKFLTGSTGDPRSRGEAFFRLLRRLRFPRLSEKEENFSRLKEALEMPEELQLEHSEGFEAEGILLRASFRDRGALARILRFLRERGSSFESFLE
jgi:hypothetical protein